MAVSSNTTFNINGKAEDFHNLIYDISPMDTLVLNRAKRLTASQTLHQWQTDSLAGATANAQIEGDDASFGTASSTTVLNNYTQISRKNLFVSRTADRVRKYGRKSELAYQLVKKGKELKRDIELGIVGNNAATAGAQASARVSAGLESWLGANRVICSNAPASAAGVATTPYIGAGGHPSVAPTDGTAATFAETDLISALGLAWADGGDASLIMMSQANKRRFNAFSGIATKYNEVKGQNQANIIGAADIYVSDYGNHTVVMNRYMRDAAVLCLDMEYIGVAWLDPIQKEELAKTGDATKYQIIGEWTLVVTNPDSCAKVMAVGA